MRWASAHSRASSSLRVSISIWLPACTPLSAGPFHRHSAPASRRAAPRVVLGVHRPVPGPRPPLELPVVDRAAPVRSR